MSAERFKSSIRIGFRNTRNRPQLRAPLDPDHVAASSSRANMAARLILETRETESRQAMSRKTPNAPSRPDKNAESDAKRLQKKARLENNLEGGLEESFPASDPPSASEPGI
jgi:hypothetical protein